MSIDSSNLTMHWDVGDVGAAFIQAGLMMEKEVVV
jgi:hypothetical protein